MHVRNQFLAFAMCAPLAYPALLAQEKSSQTSPHSALHVTGRLIGTDGVRQIFLEYKRKSGRGTFIGTVQSSCRIPASSTSPDAVPLTLSGMPKGSQMAVFYVRHLVKIKGTQRAENIILAIRFDHVNGRSLIPTGKMIPCAGGPQDQTPK